MTRHAKTQADALPLTRWPRPLVKSLVRRNVTTWTALSGVTEAEMLLWQSFGATKLNQLRVLVHASGRDLPNIGSSFSRTPTTAYQPRAGGLTQGVYFVRSGEFIKIGIAQCVLQRLKTLLTANPHDVTPLGFVRVRSYADLLDQERHFHLLFWTHRHRGEWFHAHDDILEFVRNEAEPWP